MVTAAGAAIAAQDVDLVLPFVGPEAEPEIRRTFDTTLRARELGSAAREVADLHFFETVVRLHRAGEGATYTGLKPAGLDVGPVIPLAEQALADDDPAVLVDFLATAVAAEVRRRFQRVRDAEAAADGSVTTARTVVQASLGLQVWAHRLYTSLQRD